MRWKHVIKFSLIEMLGNLDKQKKKIENYKFYRYRPSLEVCGELKPRTGLAVIDRGGCLRDVALTATDDEILEFVMKHADGDSAVGIDAPLIVPNETGLRPVERMLHKIGVHAYPANRMLFSRVHGGIRGEAMVAKSSSRGFELATAYSKQISRPIFEVFPSVAYKKLLGLNKIQRVKRRKGVGTKEMKQGLSVARDKLFSGKLRPPISIDKVVIENSILGLNIEGLRGIALDQFGDAIDATLYAYIIYRYYLDPASTTVAGDLGSGYIILP